MCSSTKSVALAASQGALSIEKDSLYYRGLLKITNTILGGFLIRIIVYGPPNPILMIKAL